MFKRSFGFIRSVKFYRLLCLKPVLWSREFRVYFYYFMMVIKQKNEMSSGTKIFMQLFLASFKSKFYLYKFLFQVFFWQFPDQVSRTSLIKAPLHKLKIYLKWFLNETSFLITIKENLKNFFSFLFRFNAEWKFFNAKQFRKAVLMCCVYEFLYLWVFLKQSL